MSQYLLKNVKLVLTNLRNPNDLIECSNNLQDVYKTIEENNRDRERNILIVIHDKNFDMLSNKKLNGILMI